MTIADRLSAALDSQERAKLGFQQQLDEHEEFRRQLRAHGVTPAQKRYDIPLFERIASGSFKAA